MDDEQRDPTHYESVPSAAIRLFRMSWQLELWLREITYVEVRASHPDWQEFLKKEIKRWPTTAVSNDKKLTHMATAHESELSYLTFGQLCDLIMSNWDLWGDYFPPLENFRSKIEEVRTIRNRVAHCRRPHTNDERRLDLFLRDLDPGVRRFCLRYSEAAPSDKSDAVAAVIARQWPEYGWSTELHSNDSGWLYGTGTSKGDPRYGARITRLCRDSEHRTGTIYRADMYGRRGTEVDVLDWLQWVVALDREPIHAIVSERELSVTLPAALGADRIGEVVLNLIRVAQNTSGRSTFAQAARMDWPEWVLFPNHPLAIFDPAYSGPILDLS